MGNCLAKINIDGEFKTYTCDDVRKNHLDWKRSFRETNKTDLVIRLGMQDEYYNDFCKQIDDFLYLTCQCSKIALKCEKCASEDHEGPFCRCESRNIELARQIRYAKEDKGQDHIGDQPERLSERDHFRGATKMISDSLDSTVT